LHSYSAFHRGSELLMGAFTRLDKGRDGTGGTMSWVRLHNEYLSRRQAIDAI
jgi:predicted dithiol-disulfide oxidoreductase (DUF899 family)